MSESFDREYDWMMRQCRASLRLSGFDVKQDEQLPENLVSLYYKGQLAHAEFIEEAIKYALSIAKSANCDILKSETMGVKDEAVVNRDQ